MKGRVIIMVGTAVREYGEHLKSASTGVKILEGAAAAALIVGTGYLIYSCGKDAGSAEHKAASDAAMDALLAKFK